MATLQADAFDFGVAHRPLRRVDIQDYLDGEKEYREPRLMDLQTIKLRYPIEQVDIVYERFWIHDDACTVFDIAQGVDNCVPEEHQKCLAYREFDAEMRATARLLNAFETSETENDRLVTAAGLLSATRQLILETVVVARTLVINVA